MLKTCLLPLAVFLSLSAISAQGVIEGAAPQVSGAPTIGNTSPIINPSVMPVIVPAADANKMTLQGWQPPWAWWPTRFQSCYLGTELPAVLVMGCMSFRTYRGDNGLTIDMEINIGYTTFNHTNITATYASNFNSGTPVNVFKRKMFVIPNNAPINNRNPRLFQVQIKFDTPFVWTKQAGRNLLVEVIIYGNNNNNSPFMYYPEACSQPGTSTSIYSISATATTGSVRRYLAPVYLFDTVCKQYKFSEFTRFGKGCQGTGGHPGHIVPVVARSRFLNTQNAATFGTPKMRWQQQINKSEMPTVPTVFLSMAERDNEVARTAAASTMTFKIEFGPTAKSSSTMTGTYASNRSTQMKVVFTGNVNMPAVSGGNRDINHFVYVVPLTTPYQFIPKANEHFLIDIANTSVANVLRYPDAESGVAAQGTRVYATGNPTATTGRLESNHCMAICFGIKRNPSATPLHTASARAVIGKTWTLDLSGARATSGAALIIGASKTLWGTTPLPLSLTGLGAPGCNLYASVDILLPVATSATGLASISLPFPNVSALVGQHLFTQYIVLDGPANAAGLVTTNGGDNKVGEL